MFSVDYPLGDNEAGYEFVRALGRSVLLSAEELDLFAFGNAERLLRLETTIQK